jgi:hypothetical protein
MRRRRQPTPEQQAAAAARRERFKVLCKRVADMSDEERSALAGQMGAVVTVEGRVLSVHNTCLIASQCPTATVVGGFAQWLKQGRAVRKGEHGLMIWVPIAQRRKGEGEPAPIAEPTGEEVSDRQRFIMATVFDVSQTQEIENGRTLREESEVAAC